MFISDFAKFVAQQEGFFLRSSVAWRNNNPGNLDNGKRARTVDQKGHAVYDKISDGWADLEDLIERIITAHPALTLETFFAGERDETGKVIQNGYSGYAPAADPRGANQPSAYAAFMAANLKIPADTVLATLMPPAEGNA